MAWTTGDQGPSGGVQRGRKRRVSVFGRSRLARQIQSELAGRGRRCRNHARFCRLPRGRSTRARASLASRSSTQRRRRRSASHSPGNSSATSQSARKIARALADAICMPWRSRIHPWRPWSPPPASRTAGRCASCGRFSICWDVSHVRCIGYGVPGDDLYNPFRVERCGRSRDPGWCSPTASLPYHSENFRLRRSKNSANFFRLRRPKIAMVYSPMHMCSEYPQLHLSSKAFHYFYILLKLSGGGSFI